MFADCEKKTHTLNENIVDERSVYGIEHKSYNVEVFWSF